MAVTSDGRLTPHDLRHCFKYWLADAGIPRDRLGMYLGWAEEGLEDRYGRPRLDSDILAADTNILSKYLERNEKRPKSVRPEKVKRFRLPAANSRKPRSK